MELVLFLIAAGIIFYLYKTFQSYLSNPIAPNDSESLIVATRESAPVAIQLSPKDKLKITEYGIIIRILGKLSFADNNSCMLEESLVHGIIKDMAKDSDKPEELYFEIYRESANEDVQELATLFAAETIAQYKKRLKVIEFMFALSYADGNFTPDEEDVIINVAAILEIENDDFNRLYDEFKSINEQKYSMSKEEAIAIFELTQDFSKEELEAKYNEAIAKNRQNILDTKNLVRPYHEFGGRELKKIAQAYAILLPFAQDKKD